MTDSKGAANSAVTMVDWASGAEQQEAGCPALPVRIRGTMGSPLSLTSNTKEGATTASAALPTTPVQLLGDSEALTF